MTVSRNPLPWNRKYLIGMVLLPLLAVICVAFSLKDDENYETARREVLLRRIGHELLLQSGDSTSRVLPVEKIDENEYRIMFENELTFQPDLLVNTTRSVLAQDPLARDYVVNVLNCGKTAVVYGYAISKNRKNDIVACKGRKQPTACYIISIKFKPTGLDAVTGGYLLGGLPILAFVGFLFYRSAGRRAEVPEKDDTNLISIGAVLFDAQRRKLIINDTTVELTATETRVLRIFALSPNTTIARSRLQKEIWEDEGVIVGRSLDMFISKLRKKLELDASVKITVIRGKGYRLEIGG